MGIHISREKELAFTETMIVMWCIVDHVRSVTFYPGKDRETDPEIWTTVLAFTTSA